MGAEGNTAVYRWSGWRGLILGAVGLLAYAAVLARLGAFDGTGNTDVLLLLAPPMAPMIRTVWSCPFAIRVAEESIELVYLLRPTVVVPSSSVLVAEDRWFPWVKAVSLRDRWASHRRWRLGDNRRMRAALEAAGYQLTDRVPY